MVVGACLYCGNAYHECECARTIEFEIVLPLVHPAITRKHTSTAEMSFDVRVVPNDDGMNVVIAVVDEQGGNLLTAQQRRVLSELWREHTGRDLYEYINAVINRCGEDTAD